eukprot:TRINITY_DN11890_c0_g1_i3.p1 TRINITY_DN11890_c0_g1~~TRINITY_DN11890_c0_g1_i3.p1  ORF type:complete len:129 (-),score=42.13 TRINITY_DN11890_c0_g1_i3:107-493(-)
MNLYVLIILLVSFVRLFFIFFFFFKQKTAYEMLRSLVGSEMCIRDSRAAITADVLKAVRGTSGSKLPFQGGAEPCAGCAEAMKEISWLRAHLVSHSETNKHELSNLRDALNGTPVSYTHLTLPTKRIV